MATYAITIGGSSRSVLLEGFTLADVSNDVPTLMCDVKSSDGSYRPTINSTIVVTENGTRIFGGLVESVSESGLNQAGNANGLRFRVSAKGYAQYASRRTITATFATGTLKSQLTTLTTYLSSYGTTLHASQANGPTMPEMAFTDRRVDDILNDLAAVSGYVWRIDHDNALRMVSPGDLTASFNVTDGSGNAVNDVVVETTRNDLYANRIFLTVTGAGPLTSTETFTTTTTGAETFTSKYPASQDINNPWPNILIDDGVPVGPIGWGTGTAAWSWDYVNHQLEHDGTAPITVGSVITVTYQIGYPFTVQADDAAGQASYGLWERRYTKGEALTIEAAQALADGLLTSSSPDLRSVYYETTQTGVSPGQTQTITLTKRNLSGTALVQEVNTRWASSTRAIRSVSAVMSGVYQGTFRGTFNQWMGNTGGGGGGALEVTGQVNPSSITLTDQLTCVGLTNSSYVRLTGRHAYSLTGNTVLSLNQLDFAMDVTSAAFGPALVGVSNMYPGQFVVLYNSSGVSFNAVHEHATTFPSSNRIYCPNSSDWTIKPNTAVLLYYDGTASRVRLIDAVPNLTGLIVNADINSSAAIAYSKLNLAASIVNADINSAAAIAYSKLNLATSIVNADVASGAAIAWSKISKSGSVMADIGDYATGTFTPAVNFGGATTGITYTNQGGWYTRIGRLVSIHINILLSSKGSATGAATITGLPLTSASTSPASHASLAWPYASNISVAPGAYVAGNSTTINVIQTGTATALDDTHFNNTSGLLIAGSYIV